MKMTTVRPIEANIIIIKKMQTNHNKTYNLYKTTTNTTATIHSVLKVSRKSVKPMKEEIKKYVEILLIFLNKILKIAVKKIQKIKVTLERIYSFPQNLNLSQKIKILMTIKINLEIVKIFLHKAILII